MPLDEYVRFLVKNSHKFASIKKKLERNYSEIIDLIEVYVALGEKEETIISALGEKKYDFFSDFDPYKDNEEFSKTEAIIEVRAAAGGDESSIFAIELFRMYERFLKAQGIKIETLETSLSDLGLKKGVYLLKGKEVNKFVYYESGVHRVQRIPVTESSGRLHTSTVTIAAIPKVKSLKVDVHEKDIRIDKFRASGSGGQHVNKTESAIRLTHIPTKITVQCQDEKSQKMNLAKALIELKKRVELKKEEEIIQQAVAMRKEDIGSGARSEKMRTYNFHFKRITDHRINENFCDMESFMRGEKLLEIAAKIHLLEVVRKIYEKAIE